MLCLDRYSVSDGEKLLAERVATGKMSLPFYPSENLKTQRNHRLDVPHKVTKIFYIARPFYSAL